MFPAFHWTHWSNQTADLRPYRLLMQLKVCVITLRNLMRPSRATMGPLALLVAAAALCCVSLQPAAAATLFEVDPWTLPPNNVSYPALAAAWPGDEIRFVWSNATYMHGVFRLFNNVSGAAGTCPGSWNASSGVELAPLAGSGNVTYTVQPQDAPFFWIACQNGRGQHCQRGQKILVQVTCAGGAGAPAAEAPAGEEHAATVSGRQSGG